MALKGPRRGMHLMGCCCEEHGDAIVCRQSALLNSAYWADPVNSLWVRLGSVAAEVVWNRGWGSLGSWGCRRMTYVDYCLCRCVRFRQVALSM